jgi:hypothetical protein
MTASVKNVVANLQNISEYLINPNNYDDNNYDEVSDSTQHKSISHGNAFNDYQMSLKNKATYITEGFNGHDDLTHMSQAVLLKTQTSNAQQQELTRLKHEYLLNQTNYNSLISTISPATDNSAKLKQLALLETTLDLLSQKINTLNDVLKNNITSVNEQISTNSSAREEYMNDITSTNTRAANMINISDNIQNMLNDSSIVTLQKNYSYILFSILAAASILIAMNVIKNN